MNSEIHISFKGGKRVAADYGKFEILTDQSAKYGGGETAPEPFALFLASIGTCAGVFVLGFCQARQIPTDGIRLVQRMETSDKGVLTKVSIDVVVPPSFPEKYRGAVARVVDACAVKKAIQDPPVFEARTVVG
jgi:putative redox protein